MEGEEQAAAWTEAPEPVQVTTHSNGYLELRLNRTAKFNSLDTEMLEIISRALDDHLGSATGIVLSAAPGRAFCAGGDIKFMHECAASGKLLVKTIDEIFFTWWDGRAEYGIQAGYCRPP